MSTVLKNPINYFWPAVGFAAGTGAVGSLVLSTSVFERGMVGMIVGGVPMGLAGLWYAARQAKRGDCEARAAGEDSDAKFDCQPGDAQRPRDKPPGIWLDFVVGAIVLAAVLVVVSAVTNGIQSGRWPAGLTPFRDPSQPVK